MGLESGNDGGNTVYLNVVAGAIWQTQGKQVTTDHPNYATEDYEFGDNSGTRKGLKFGALAGHLQSVFIKENKFGEQLKVYVEDQEDGQLYCLGLKIDKGWNNYNAAKRMMIAIMMLDRSKPFTIHLSGNQDGDFFNQTLWVSQEEKNLALNPNADPEKFDASKQIAMPDEVKEMLDTTRTKTVEERKVMKPKQKERAREDELEDIVGLLKEFFLDDINKDVEEKKTQKTATKPKQAPVEETTQPEPEQPDAEPEQETAPPEKTGSATSESRADRLAKIRARQGK